MSDGRTVWWPKDAAWWRREHVVALGEEFGPAGPAVLDWLTCEAKAQNDGGWVKAGVRSCARGAFVPVDVVGAVLARAAALGALDDYELADGRVGARISGWAQDNERGRAAFRKSQQRERERHDPSHPVTDGHGESVKGQERTGQQDAAVAASAADPDGSPFDADVLRLCHLQSDLARARTGQSPASRRLRPTRRWHEEMDRLLRLDGRTPEQVEYVIRWVDRHGFWAQNVLAPDALRRHFDRFAAAIAAESRRPPPTAAAAVRDRGAARRARAAVAFAQLVQPGEQIEGRESRDVA